LSQPHQGLGRGGRNVAKRPLSHQSADDRAVLLLDEGLRFDGVETACVMGRLYAAARLYVNFFQPSFKLKEKRREGAKVIKRYHEPSTSL
jgi:hypothetical protein